MWAHVGGRRAKLLAVALLAGLSVGASLLARERTSVQAQLTGSELIEGYRRWTRVNPVPAVFHSRIATLCAAPTAKQTEMETGNPHRDKFITVYVNDIGEHAMMREKRPRFPRGSVIVKEKLPSREGSPPELLTAMIKREPGYNPGSGDWEYMVLDGAGREVRARGRLESCQSCHLSESHNDYVSRNYLPEDVRKNLR